MKLGYYLEKALSFLRVKPLVGGLEISDLVIRLGYFDGQAWHVSGVRLEPGLMESGKIKNYDKFVVALKTLKSQVFLGRDLKRNVNVVVSLSSISIYSQVFSLPIIEGENLSKAIELNIQMVSPIEASQAYSGWQKVGQDQGALRLEILSAFIDKNVVDELGRALLDAGFRAVAIESRALALARLFREKGAGLDSTRPYILISLDNSGLDFLIIRRGQLYFEYFNPWRDIMDEKGQILTQSFEAAIIRSLHQVLNFYSQHWQESLTEVVLSATALSEEAARIIKDNFSLTVKGLKLEMDQPLGPEWFVVLGCGLRGLVPRGKDKEMSLLGIGAEEEFHMEQLTNFARFWRLVVPVALGFLVLTFFLSDLFLVQTRRSLESQLLFNLGSEQAKENQALQANAEDFNRSVAFIKSVQGSAVPKNKLWEKIRGLITSSGLTPVRFNFQSADSPITLNGEAKSEDNIINFKKLIEGDPGFQEVNLPLSEIKPGPSGLSFSMTFRLKQ